MSLALLLPLALAPAAPQSLGPAVPDPASGHAYRISDVEVTIDEALELARLAGGTLLALESAAEESWVRGTFGVERFWLGLEFPRERWANGAPLEYAHWDEGEPSHGDREAFTVANWKRDSGAWNDVSGEGDRFRAVVELASEPDPGASTPLARLPAPASLAGRCALVLVVEGLTQADLEDERNPGLNRLWHAGAQALAAAEPSGDALASWGLITQGVGQAKSDLVDVGKPPRTTWYPTLLERLEVARAEVTTAWILDDPELSRLLASGGKMDLRVAQRGDGRAKALEDVRGRPAPLCALLGHSALGAERDERTRALRALDAELSALLAALEQRPGFAQEDWLVVLAGTPPRRDGPVEASAKPRRKEGPLEVPVAPLVLRGRRFAPGPWHGTIGLADIVPTVAAHFGLRPGIAWALDGRALDARTPELGHNLLENGGAEAQRVHRLGQGPVPGWTSNGAVLVDVYGAKGLTLETPGPEPRGTNHFRGGRLPLAELEQRIDVRALAEAIDARRLRAELSGWLGGRAEGEQSVELELACLAENDKELERFVLGPVGTSERRKELGAAKGIPLPGLLSRSLGCDLPKGTRTLRVTLRMNAAKNGDRARADELALVLHER